MIDLGRRNRQRRLQSRGAGFAPDIHGAFKRGGAGPAGVHRAQHLRRQARGLFGLADQRGVVDEARDDAGLVADLMQMAEPLADIGGRNLSDQRQYLRIHRIGREQRSRGIQKTGTGDDGIGLRLAGRERCPERHIGGALLVAGMNGAEPVGEFEQSLEQEVVLGAGERIDRIEAVADQGGDNGLGRCHRLCRLRGLGLRWHKGSLPPHLCRKALACRGGGPSGLGPRPPLDNSARRMRLCADFSQHWRN